MDTVEIVTYILVALIAGGLIIFVVGKINSQPVEKTISDAYRGPSLQSFTKTDNISLTPLLFKLWNDCSQGAVKKSLVFQYNSNTINANAIAQQINNNNLCGTLGLSDCGCGNRDDITFGGQPIRDCNAPALEQGKIYKAICNATTETLDIDTAPQPCQDTRTDIAVCAAAQTPCGTVNDECGVTRQCTDCHECTTDAQCTTPPKNACCGNACADKQTDKFNCGTCGNACPTGQTCRQGNCQAPFMVELAQDKALVLNAGHEDWSGYQPGNGGQSYSTGFNYPLTVLHNPDRLVTGQQVTPQTCVGSCEINYATGFTLNDPMNPAADNSVTINRIAGDYGCHGVNEYASFAASPSMTYQVATFANSCGVVGLNLPPSGKDYDIGGDREAAYDIAQNGADTFAVLNNGLTYLTGITPKPNPPSGKFSCPFGDTRCYRKLFTLATPPSTTPTIGLATKAVSGDNIVTFGCAALSGQGCSPDKLLLYALEQPTAVQTIVLSAEMTALLSSGHQIALYVRTLPQGTFVVMEEWGTSSIVQPHHVQVFTLVGSGATARFENATSLFALPQNGYMSTLVSIGNEPVLVDLSMGNAYPLSIHAYLLSELAANPATPRDAFDAPPAFLATDGIIPDVTQSIASYNKDVAAYLYFYKRTDVANEQHVWKLVRKQ